MGKKNKVKDLEIKENINSKELNKFEKIKKFRDLENASITYGNNEKYKFKDFQEIYELINNEIEVQDKKWICSEKDNIYYILQYNFFTTERLKGEYSVFISSKEEKNNLNNIKKVSNRIRNKGFEFSLPDKESIKLLENIKFLGSGHWIYSYKKNGTVYPGYIYISNSFYYTTNYGFNLLGVYKLNKFLKFIEDRNKKYNLIENDNLKRVEVILNYDLLDSSIITKEYEKKFNKLIETYKTYKDYISCIYNEDDEKVGILFDIDKITESIKDSKRLFNSIEINYLENELGIEKEIVYSDKNVYYYKNSDIEEVYNINSEGNKSIYHFKNENVEERTYKNGILNGKSILKLSNGGIEERNYRNGI